MTLIERLRRKTVAGVPVFNTPLEEEAARRIEQLEAFLRKVRKGYQPSTLFAEIDEALNSAPETPVSTLCAVCDQIKELHPATHPWTARPRKRERS